MNKKLVKENMSTHLITIEWNDKMESAYNRMQKNRVRHLPVVNDVGEVVGMLSDRDVQRAMISEVEASAGHVVADETIEFDQDSKVRDYMSWPAKTVDYENTISRVAERMVAEKVSSFLVCNGHRAVGIVTAEDLLKVLIQVLSDPQSSSRWTLSHILEDTYSQLKHTLV